VSEVTSILLQQVSIHVCTCC